MSIFSSIDADVHNEELARKAKELKKAIDAQNWDLVKKIHFWMSNGPFSE